MEYLARRLGHRCVRINNHEHTDIQEYTGSYAADGSGKLAFKEVRVRRRNGRIGPSTSNIQSRLSRRFADLAGAIRISLPLAPVVVLIFGEALLKAIMRVMIEMMRNVLGDLVCSREWCGRCA